MREDYTAFLERKMQLDGEFGFAPGRISTYRPRMRFRRSWTASSVSSRSPAISGIRTTGSPVRTMPGA